MSGIAGKSVDLIQLGKVFNYIKPYKKYLLTSILVIMFTALIAPIRPLLVQYSLDKYISGKDIDGLLLISALIMAILIIESILQYAETYIANLLGQNVVRDIRKDLFKKIINFRIAFFDDTPIGTLVTRTVSDIQSISEIFSQGLLMIIGDVLKLVFVLVIMFYSDWKLSLITLSTIPVLLISTYIFKNAVRKAFQEVRTQIARLNAFVQEHITGMNIVQNFNMQDRELKKFTEINAMHRDAHIRSVWHYSVFFPVVEILSATSVGLIVWYGSNGVLTHQVTAGSIVAFIMYVNMLFRPIRQLADRFNVLQMGMVSAERVFGIMEKEESISNKGKIVASSIDSKGRNKDGVKHKLIEGKIEFRNVWFAYKNQDWVIKDLSFIVQPGSTVALVGKTGSGKSSVINLLNRFYDFQRGSILIDNIDIRDYELGSLRSQIGVVVQDVFLFSDSIRNNITMHNPAITEEMVINAASETGAANYINLLPGKLDFNVMERGGLLSTGQRQLIAFMRAFVYDPSILVLDEATSSVDMESEELIKKATLKITKGRTSVIVAHRLATIRNADRIIVLEKGSILQAGNHNELIEMDGKYKELYEMQFEDGVI